MKKTIIPLFIVCLLLTPIGIIRAGGILPQVTTVCESKVGVLYAYDDGFSIFKKCQGKDRVVLLVGQQGAKGDKGDQGPVGPMGPQGLQGNPGLNGKDGINGLPGQDGVQGSKGEQGEKGDKGDPGIAPVALESTIFPQGYLRHDSYSDVKDFIGHQILTLDCVFTEGSGGVWVYYSSDNVNWNLDYRAGCGGSTNDDHKQTTSKLKGNYYKFKIVNTFSGEIKALAY